MWTRKDGSSLFGQAAASSTALFSRGGGAESKASKYRTRINQVCSVRRARRNPRMHTSSPCRHAIPPPLSNRLTALCAGQARNTGNYAVVREQLKKPVSAAAQRRCVCIHEYG